MTAEAAPLLLPSEVFLTRKEVCGFCNITRQCLWEHCKDGKLAFPLNLTRYNRYIGRNHPKLQPMDVEQLYARRAGK